MLPAVAVSYCERAGDGFWAEPLNAFSNLAFLLAALLIVARCRRRGTGSVSLYLLVVLTVAIAAGSFLWHTLRLPWAQWLDVAAIALFIAAYLVIYTRRHLGPWAALFAVLLWLLLNGLVPGLFPAGFLNGGLYYLPTLLLLIGLLVLSRGERTLVAMLVLFVISLSLRTLDAGLCGVFPAGTHFGWHLVNALVLYLAMRSVTD